MKRVPFFFFYHLGTFVFLERPTATVKVTASIQCVQVVSTVSVQEYASASVLNRLIEYVNNVESNSGVYGFTIF